MGTCQPYHWQLGVRATIWLADTTVSYRVQPIGTRRLRFELPLLATTQLEQHTPRVTSTLPKDPSKMLCRANLCENVPGVGEPLRIAGKRRSPAGSYTSYIYIYITICAKSTLGIWR